MLRNRTDKALQYYGQCPGNASGLLPEVPPFLSANWAPTSMALNGTMYPGVRIKQYLIFTVRDSSRSLRAVGPLFSPCVVSRHLHLCSLLGHILCSLLRHMRTSWLSSMAHRENWIALSLSLSLFLSSFSASSSFLSPSLSLSLSLLPSAPPPITTC